MNIREQEFVLAIARHGNLKGASEELNISSPGLSVFLSTLERNTGARLFHRVGKKFVPTAAGNLYINAARQMVEAKNRYDTMLSDMINGVTGTIRVGMHPRRTTFLLPRAMKKLSIVYPDVSISVMEGTSRELFDALMDGELDFAVANTPLEGDALESDWFYSERLVAVLSPSHPLASAGTRMQGEHLAWIDLSLFNGEIFILQYPDQAARIYTDKAIEFADARPGRKIIIANLETASQMAAEGLGIAFNLMSFTRNFTYEHPVKYFLVGDTRSRVVYTIVRRKDRYKPRYAEVFIAAMKDAMSEERGEAGVP